MSTAEVGRLVMEQLDAAAEHRASQLSITDIVVELGGNRPAAATIGVSVRTVERWRKAERGEAGETRRPRGRTAAAVGNVRTALGREAIAAALEEDGFQLHRLRGRLKDPSGKARDREKEELDCEPDEDDPLYDQMTDSLQNLADAYRDRDEAGIGQHFAEVFLMAWGHGTMPVDSLESGGFVLETLTELSLSVG